MKTLLILRHAKSSWGHPEQPDHERPLNKRGKHDAPRMGKLLREEDLVPDIIMSSTARRARETAERVIEASGFEGSMLLIPEFYHGSYETILELLRELPENADCVMVVGHNPELEEFIQELADEYARMPTAALAKVELPIQRWGELRETVTGKLIKVWYPRENP
jgi:phosphohistidine phosphatase